MKAPKDVKLVVVGSIGLDTIETPFAKRESLLGGSLSYACAAASFFVPVGMVGIVGNDFPAEYVRLYEKFGIDLRGLQYAQGDTFRWSGVYDSDMNNRRTLETRLNVFESFLPALPASYRKCPFLFLANISPTLQLHVLSQLERPKFVAADTMDLWIKTAREPLMDLVSKVQMLMLNESEARQLTDEYNLVRAARKILGWGPRYVVVKKGEHGALLFSRSGILAVPAYPLEEVHDPTGAGDTFAGGLMGWLAGGGKADRSAVKRAMAYGTVVASFGVESFSLDRLSSISLRDIESRLRVFGRMLAV